MNPELKEVLNKIPKQPQSQAATLTQLRDLQEFANRLGLYDAADFLKIILEKK